jgi:formate dehydrogenase beta subunit
MVPSDRTITSAVGHGKKAARAIDAWLRGSTDDGCAEAPGRVSFEMLHLPVYSDAERTRGSRAVAAGTHSRVRRSRRRADRSAGTHMRRSAACPAATASSATNCFAACPEQAIVKLGPGRRYRYRLRTLHGLRGLL